MVLGLPPMNDRRSATSLAVSSSTQPNCANLRRAEKREFPDPETSTMFTRWLLNLSFQWRLGKPAEYRDEAPWTDCEHPVDICRTGILPHWGHNRRGESIHQGKSWHTWHHEWRSCQVCSSGWRTWNTAVSDLWRGAPGELYQASSDPIEKNKLQ